MGFREGRGPALLDEGLSVAPLSPAPMLPGHSSEGVMWGWVEVSEEVSNFVARKWKCWSVVVKIL